MTLQRGLHELRVSDVADELAVSSGLIHYHFATKDELIETMLGRWPTGRSPACDARCSGRRPEERLARVIDMYLPSLRRDPSWLLWIDVWGEALRAANLRRISEELDNAWVR